MTSSTQPQPQQPTFLSKPPSPHCCFPLLPPPRQPSKQNINILQPPNQLNNPLLLLSLKLFQYYLSIYYRGPHTRIRYQGKYSRSLSFRYFGRYAFIHIGSENCPSPQGFRFPWVIIVIMIYKFFSSSLPKRGFSDNKKFFSSITSTIKGFLNPNAIQEHNPKLTQQQKENMKQFLIYRYNPNDENEKPRYVSYYVDLKKIPPMYLDALLYVKDYLDPTLSLRRSCRQGICGSCAMNCDGLHTLACIKAIDTDLTKPAIITPLGHMFVLKDLVVDLTHFYAQYKSIEPYLKRKYPKPANSKEYFMSVADRKKLDGLYECVMCACCTTSCPSYWWHPEAYLGPAVLQQAYRWIMDTRDEYTQERLDKLDKGINISECQNIGMCSVTCPKGLDPQYAINELLKMIDVKNSKREASAI